jgi:alcohol dehydrogenase class IV
MDSFEYSALPGRVVFGKGSIKKLPDEIKRLNKLKPLLLSTPQQADQVKALEPILKDASITPAGLYSNATMHTPTHVTEDALKYAKDCGADSIISFGGGSTIGLGKAISIRTGLEHICISTTYAGSEMTPILGETADGKKTTRSDPKILPGTTIYDVDFTMTLPPEMSATSGVNAIAHAGKSYKRSS